MTDTVPAYPFAHPAALDPSPEWEQLRNECPVARIRLVSGDEALLVTRYDDVKGLLADPRFTHSLARPDAAKISASDDGGVFNREESAMIASPDHPRWRRMMNRSFTVKRVTAMRPRIEQIAHRLIDEMVAAGQPGDLQSALGFPLPVFVICELLGVDPGYRDTFSHWSDAMLNLTRFDQAELTKAAVEFQEFMAQHVRDKRAEPGDDLLSELAAIVDSQDGRMTETELVLTAQGLLVAGHETTANMIGKMVAMLLADRPARWERLVADRGLINSAVEESLRFDANPGIGLPRYISEDIEIAGCPVKAGTVVMASMAAGNRDETAYEQAGEMRLDRSPNPHLSFGAGPHSCLGQALARTELQVTLAVLLDRLPTLELAVPPEELRRRTGLIVGGLEEVPVRW
ncbi:cytochrome P450 [Actinoplanes sp. SE50]|uniref:cytochrome P450 n=1 Tax=unclassified Actinoplanes TaxID=2626549 RepID=UPI00023EC0C0|nr:MULTISPECIES: cytochrome P450 [unclassified Actinoplanes]AEV84057.1 Cytochrome P450 [Actinoplanes sp. SE50/110]ATO82449.1 cytochrome P450 [Actinoplanes sp. SE50]SLL99856.1 cytochrome P450 [Actinoplanes sp. SE50/110]